MARSHSKHLRKLEDGKCVDDPLLLESNSKLIKGWFGIGRLLLGSGSQSRVSEIRKEHQVAQNAAVYLYLTQFQDAGFLLQSPSLWWSQRAAEK